ncbi:MAG: hypothetical protein ACFFBS_06245 [Promethearchaeota archaeon]
MSDGRISSEIVTQEFLNALHETKGIALPQLSIKTIEEKGFLKRSQVTLSNNVQIVIREKKTRIYEERLYYPNLIKGNKYDVIVNKSLIGKGKSIMSLARGNGFSPETSIEAVRFFAKSTALRIFYQIAGNFNFETQEAEDGLKNHLNKVKFIRGAFIYDFGSEIAQLLKFLGRETDYLPEREPIIDGISQAFALGGESKKVRTQDSIIDVINEMWFMRKEDDLFKDKQGAVYLVYGFKALMLERMLMKLASQLVAPKLDDEQIKSILPKPTLENVCLLLEKNWRFKSTSRLILDQLDENATRKLRNELLWLKLQEIKYKRLLCTRLILEWVGVTGWVLQSLRTFIKEAKEVRSQMATDTATFALKSGLAERISI